MEAKVSKVLLIADLITIIADQLDAECLYNFTSTCKFIFEACRATVKRRIDAKNFVIDIGIIKLIGIQKCIQKYSYHIIYILPTIKDMYTITYIMKNIDYKHWSGDNTASLIRKDRLDILALLPPDYLHIEYLLLPGYENAIDVIDLMHKRDIGYWRHPIFIQAIHLANIDMLEVLCYADRNLGKIPFVKICIQPGHLVGYIRIYSKYPPMTNNPIHKRELSNNDIKRMIEILRKFVPIEGKLITKSGHWAKSWCISFRHIPSCVRI